MENEILLNRFMNINGENKNLKQKYLLIVLMRKQLC